MIFYCVAYFATVNRRHFSNLLNRSKVPSYIKKVLRFSKFDVAILVSSGLCLLLDASFLRIVCWVWRSPIFFFFFFFGGGEGFLKPTDQPTSYHRLPTNLPTEHLPPTTNQVHRQPTNRSRTNKKYEDQKFYNKF